jgi:hypothetical protein
MKRFISLSLLISILVSCHTIKNKTNSKIFQQGIIIFEKYLDIDEQGENNFKAFQDSIIQILSDSLIKLGKESEVNNIPKFSLVDLLVREGKSEYIIEVNQDTIWRYHRQGSRIIDDYMRIERTNGKVFFHSKNNKAIINRTFDLFLKNGEYKIQVDKTQRKKILELDCYKVLITEKESEEGDLPFSLGDTIIEMYVTDKINLPVHAIYNVSQPFLDFFPLEFSIEMSNLRGAKDIYKAIRIIHH